MHISLNRIRSTEVFPNRIFDQVPWHRKVTNNINKYNKKTHKKQRFLESTNNKGKISGLYY